MQCDNNAAGTRITETTIHVRLKSYVTHLLHDI